MMSRLVLTAVLTTLATGCIYERRVVVRERVQAPPPPPADDEYSTADQQPAARPPPPDTEVDTEVFNERLSPYGHWEFVPDYGRVWVPFVAATWRPYYYGHWVLTDYGWTFASDDPWGWAAYHYGRWNYGPGFGWYWIPGRVWAPAWVSWRYGGGYVTWCPLGPAGVVYGYDHPAWVAVRETHFTQPVATVAVSVHATASAVSSAAPLAGPHATAAVGRGNFGPPVARIQAATGQAIRPVAASSVIPAVRAGPSARAASPDPIRSPAPRATSTPGAPSPRGLGAYEREPGAVRPGAAAVGAQGAPAARGLGRSEASEAPRPRGLSGGAPAAGGLGRQGSSGGYGGAYRPAPRPSGGGPSGGGPSGGGPSGGGGAAPHPSGGAAPRASGGGSHPAPAPAPSARGSGNGHSDHQKN
jgi:hypothetical protein